jgi:hypothetical protein
MNLEAVWNRAKWRTYTRFKLSALRHGIKDEKAIRRFYLTRVQHDKQGIKPVYVPIFARQGGAYQFDTWDQRGVESYYLIVINVNTRKAYQYPMEKKNATCVHESLIKFWKEAPDCKTMVSDQDSAYLSKTILDAFKAKNIKLSTTTDNDHHALGIINRLMRTIRDIAGGDEVLIKPERMEVLIGEYNASIHSATGFAPDSMTAEDEQKYIAEKTQLKDMIPRPGFGIGSFVRILLPKPKIGKVRSNYSMVSYKVIQEKGRSYIVEAKDGSVDTIPAFQLLKCDVKKYPQAETLKDDKRAVIERIISYSEKTDSYMVKFENEAKLQKRSATVLREGNPTLLSREEKIFWIRKCPNFPEGVPAKILQMIPKIVQKKFSVDNRK